MLNKCLLKEQPNICTVNKALCYTLAHFILKEPYEMGRGKYSPIEKGKLRLREACGLHTVTRLVVTVLLCT